MSDGTIPPAAGALTDSRLATICAEKAEQAFRQYDERFLAITRRARERFLARDWPGTYADASERLYLYGRELDSLTSDLEAIMEGRLHERNLWTAIKAVYSSLIARCTAWEIAESFFNSLTRRIFATEGVDQAIEFVDTDFDAPPTATRDEVRKLYTGNEFKDLIVSALTDECLGGFPEECWDDLRGAAGSAAGRIEAGLGACRAGDAGEASAPAHASLEIIGRVFYRGRGAYFVGRAAGTRDEKLSMPVAFCLRYATAKGITLDALLVGELDLAILFSYTRAYFRVEVECPHELVRALRQLMPGKRLVDLYNAVGFHRHGKTELYRDFVAHLRQSNDRFTFAEGTRGMVMLVFTLPSYDVVFKLIKDRFDFPKESNRSEVLRRYRLVFEHDRAGRLIEAHEFEHLRIARDRFEPELLDQLLREAAMTVRIEGDDVVLAHVYVERRIRPLNLFFGEADQAAGAAAARDYGQAIRDLAASNIFPGDLLTKNFGVTRRGRVVFYDYDELCFVTDCNFRTLPQPTTPEQEMAAEPWFSVRENDVFPEEFPQFLGLPETARPDLFERHADLFRPDFWRDVQQKFRSGELPEIFPYISERRLGENNGEAR